jgi:hypothetical protein
METEITSGIPPPKADATQRGARSPTLERGLVDVGSYALLGDGLASRAGLSAGRLAGHFGCDVPGWKIGQPISVDHRSVSWVSRKLVR